MRRSDFDIVIEDQEKEGTSNVEYDYDDDTGDVSIVGVRVYQQDGQLSVNLLDVGLTFDEGIEEEWRNEAIQIEADRIEYGFNG